ncbi:MAG: transposase [Desulfovibrio sp.]|nr:transposase [Desulfovibrio sp.]
MTSDGGGMLLRAADKLLWLTQKAARCFTDFRRRASCSHNIEAMLRQRIYALALGYEDLSAIALRSPAWSSLPRDRRNAKSLGINGHACIATVGPAAGRA